MNGWGGGGGLTLSQLSLFLCNSNARSSQIMLVIRITTIVVIYRMAVQLYVQAHLGHYHILTQEEYSQKEMIQLKSMPLFTFLLNF